jgi:hypothetical protein
VVFYNTFTKHRLIVVMPYRHAKDAFGGPAWLLQCVELDVEVCVTESALAREPYKRQGALIRGEMLDDGEWRHRFRVEGGRSGEE